MNSTNSGIIPDSVNSVNSVNAVEVIRIHNTFIHLVTEIFVSPEVHSMSPEEFLSLAAVYFDSGLRAFKACFGVTPLTMSILWGYIDGENRKFTQTHLLMTMYRLKASPSPDTVGKTFGCTSQTFVVWTNTGIELLYEHLPEVFQSALFLILR